MAKQVYLAVDLGAGSGRVLAGCYEGGKLRIEEVNRFANNGVRLPSGWHWAILETFAEIKNGLRKAAREYGDQIRSVSIDTWGVDYGLIDASGRLLGVPWMYRDHRTDGMMDEVAKLMPREEMYRRTGLQFMQFNTVFQLAVEARRNPGALAAADRLMLMPDLLTFWLSGEKAIERTNASTTQLLKVGTAEWDFELAEKVGIPAQLLTPLTDPATVIGTLLPEMQQELGAAAWKVILCGSHDTASAVAGVPSAEAQPLFLSSGTWSMIGRELCAPLVNAETYAAGFANEQGLEGTTRFLKNVAGMWLLQECKRCWEEQGISLGYGELVEQAAAAKTSTLIDPDAPEFQKPCDMPRVIAAFILKNGGAVPSTPGEFVRIILRSLARRYGELAEQMRRWMPDLPDTLHIVGGGSQNHMLNQLTADATGLRVVAGPVEATAAGNILAQMIALGEISSLEEGRRILRDSFHPTIFEPINS
jgi:rhamnulokinase